jgi:diaminopimelate epimerase
MTAAAFAKYEGLGNDFLVLDADEWPAAALTPDLARRLCDRHRGVGGDGLLWVDRAGIAEGRVRLVILNADGSRPEMCGNGVRCVAAWLLDRAELAVGDALVVDSDAGPRPVRVRAARDGVAEVEVAMGRAAVAGAAASVAVGGARVAVRAVDMGNPHGVVFGPGDDAMGLVRAVTALPEFPKGVNVELVAPEEGGFRVRVHERGVGWTQACGTGACAVAAAAVAEGRWRAGEAVTVRLDGGPLVISVAEGTWEVTMTGPARRAFAGTVG